MKVLITGANGFIAQNLVEKLSIENFEVYGLDIQKETSLNFKKYFSKDISERFYLNEEFDYVIHLAALNRTNIDADIEYKLFHQVNVVGAQNVAQCCKFKKFIFMSSVNIYDKNADIITEESKIEPIGYYAQSKWEAEKLLKATIPEEKLVIIRSSNVTGVNQKEVAIIPFFFHNAISNKEINIFVPQNRTIQLLEVNDLARVFIMIMKSDIYGTYNVAPENSLEIRRLAEKIVSMCGSESKIKITNPQFEKKALVSSNLIKSTINWKTEKNIYEILDEYYDYLFK